MHHQAAPVTPVHVPRQPRMVIASTWKISFGIASEKGACVAICAETLRVDLRTRTKELRSKEKEKCDSY